MKKIYSLLIGVLMLAASTSVSAQSYCIPSYTGYGFQNTGQAIAFFTHIKNVSFSNLNKSTTPPAFYTQLTNYQDYTTDTAEVAKTGTYPLTIFLGNGANPQTVAVWIDWNQNYIFESNERQLAVFDPMNQGTHIIKANITIPASAKSGVTRMRVGTKLSNSLLSPDPCKNNDANTTTSNWSQDFQDYSINIKPAATQVFIGATAFRNNFDEVTQGSTDNLILGIEVTTNNDGVLSPLSTGDFTFSTLGTSNPSELSEAKIYYTGLSPDFSIANQVGNGFTNPNGKFVMNGTQKLEAGKNYFWLVYDINSPAIIGNDISARLLSVKVSNIDRTPKLSNPFGTRKIGYCVSKGTQMNFIGIYNVQMGTIKNNTFYQQFSPYTYYSNLRDTLVRGQIDTIKIQLGNGVNSSKVKVWMDWNRDGDFSDQGELIYDTVNFTAQQTTAIYPFLNKGFLVPTNATVGLTRMRVSSQQRPIAVLDACTNPIDIGEVEDYNVLISEDGEPVAEFKNSIACLGDATNFYDNSYTFGNFAISEWSWDFGDPNSTTDTSTSQNPTYTYTTPGVYSVTLTVNSNKPGQAQSITKAVTIEKPIADFSYTAPVFQTPITFNDLTSGGNVFNWRWFFGDPQSGKNDSAKGSTPVHVFDTSGTYIVTLIVQTQGGCLDTITKTIKILQQQVPISDFTASDFNPYVLQNVNLIDQSVNVPTKWKWTISPSKYTYKNGTNDSTQNPVLSFDTLTTYTVFLEAINAAGSTTTNKTITTKNYSKPKAKIGAQTNFVRVSEQVNFIDSSSFDPTAWNWNFGDTASGTNNNSNIEFPSHAYSKAGFYTIGLRVTNPGGTDTTTRVNYVEVSDGYNMCDNTVTSSKVAQGFLFDSGGPSGNYNDGDDCGFLIEPACAGKITFNISSFNFSANDYLQVYDGRDSVLGIPLHTGKGFTGSNIPGVLTANSGALYIREMTDGSGNSAGFSASWNTTLNVKPKAKIGNDSIAYINSPTNFKNTTSAGYQNKYYWDFNNDGIDDDSSISPVHTYSSLGMVKVRLIAVNCAGSDTIYKDINIKNPTQIPVADFISNKDTVAIADYVNLTDLSTNGPSSWLWEITPAGGAIYVNGTSNTSQNPELVFAAPGNYSVCLTATNVIGNSIKTCKSNYIIVKDRQTMCSGNPSTKVAAGFFYDSGDQGADYGNNEFCNFLIQPCADNVVLSFRKFDVAPGDFLRVYDGIDNTGIALFNGNGFTGTNIPGPFTGYSGSLYIEFESDASKTSSGWEADWSSGAVTSPKANFTVPKTVYSNSVTWLKNTSTGKSPSYEWDFDNNGTVDSTNKEGYYIYPSSGVFNTNLTANNCAGSDSKLQQITVVAPTAKPVAGFYADFTMGDINSTITLFDTSLNGVNQWTWDITPTTGWSWFEEKGYMQKINFTDTGVYSVCLTSGNSFGTNKVCKNAYITIREYCKPAPSYFTGVGISKISLHTYAQNSPLDKQFTDYTYLGVVTKLERKANYTLTLEKNVSGVVQNWKGWIDWNDNGTFEGSEMIMNEPATSNTSVSSSINVAKNAILGIHRLRVSASYSTNSNQPCNVAFGEVEDYLIEVINDITKPVITLIGSNPDSLEQGYTFTDKGATAFDNADGIITSKIIKSNNVNNMVLGNYQATYDVTDSAGNKATQVIRTVLVTDDLTAPVVNIIGSAFDTIEVYSKYIDLGYTANDLVNGNISSKVVVTGKVDTAKLGTYTLTYTSTDVAGNSANTTRDVTVRDSKAPVITLIGTDTVKINCKDTYTEPGFTVKDNYDTLTSANVIVTGSVNSNVNGVYTLTYNVKDKSNNNAVGVKRYVKVSGCPNGIEELINNNNILVYPNPAKDFVTVEAILPDHIINTMNMSIFDEMGRLVVQKPITQGKNNIELNSLASGMYLIRIQSGNEYMQVKVVKQ